MEKRVLIAAVLSVALLSLYSQIFLKPQASPPSKPGQPAAVSVSQSAFPELAEEPVSVLSNKDLDVAVGATTGHVRSVTLKQFQQTGGREHLVIAGRVPLVAFEFEHKISQLTVIKEVPGAVSFDAVDTTGNNYNIQYGLESDKPILNLRINKIKSIGNETANFYIFNSWLRSDSTNGRSNILQIKALEITDENREKYFTVHGPVSTNRIVPHGTILLSLSERYFCQSVKPTGVRMQVIAMPAPDSGDIMTKSSVLLDTNVAAAIYFGSTDYFKLRDAGFERAFPIGALSQIGLILLSILSMIASVTRSYGTAIILFSIIITCLTAPFTIVSYRSMRKMQELKPRIDKIMAEHKNDSAGANRLVFQLYREHHVNPLSGCLPMLLQMPVLIAMFQALSHFIQLRGKSFLWISDLSMPDRIVRLPFTIPLLGHELNILPVIMAVLMYFQTRLSQGQMQIKDQANPTAAMMSGPIMPVMFCLMFYHFPSSLVLYWLTNSAMSLIWYKAAR